MNKKPWLAAILNFFFLGAGYLYNGKRKIFGSILLAASLVMFIDLAANKNATPNAVGSLGLFGALLTAIAFSYDAYTEARSINKKG